MTLADGAFVPGPLRFLRYAHAPNALGYCGPEQISTLLEYESAGVVDGGLLELLRAFEGAWPYLEVLAASAEIDDPLDARVVEAYWLGTSLLDVIDERAFVRSLEERFSRRTADWSATVEAVAPGALPNHAFHVFRVYPWVGLMRTGAVDAPLHVLDQCRISWGSVVDRHGDDITVEVEPLVWSDHRLSLGPAVTRRGELRPSTDGRDVALGDRVSLHWGQLCEVLTAEQVVALRRHTAAQLAWANTHLAPSFA